jgi:hypothetical protein
MPAHRPSLLLAALAALTASSAVPVVAQECSCPRTFEFVTAAMRDNYAGWRDKVTPRTQPALDSITEHVRARAAAARTDLECTQAVQEWLNFFRDRHVGLAYTPPSGAAPAAGDTSAASIRARFADWPRLGMTEDEARRYLDENRGRLDPVEGIWEGIGSPYRVAIVRTPGAAAEFSAVVLRADSVWWMPGQVKATFRADTAGAYASRFYMRDHTEQAFGVRMNRNLMFYSGGFVWARRYPQAADDVDPARYTESQNTRFAVRRLSPRTLVVTVPTMDHTRRPELDSVLAAHHDEIVRTPNLVIDVRGNGGGSDVTYFGLLPLLYTDSIRSVGVSILSTPENIRKFELVLQDTTFPAAQKPPIRQLVEQLRARPGELVDRGPSARGYDSVLPLPRRVAVLMDRGCGSSCEQFVLAARDSRKVTLFGDRTAGVLDYANVHALDTPCPHIRLNYATSRSNRLPHDPVDPHGIAPQVPVPADELFPVEWVQRWLEAQGG